MGIIMTLIIGFLAGLVARFLKPGDDNMGLIMTTILGIAGAFVGGYLGQLFGIYRVGEPAGFIASVIGAVLILFVVGAVMRTRPRYR